jgi:hypothetical protein
MSRLPTVTHLMRKVFSILNRAEKLEKVHDMSPLLQQQDGAHQQISFWSPWAKSWQQVDATERAANETDQRPTTSDILKETLLTSLQMQHLLVLAGSGCSIEVNGPSMTSLWKQLTSRFKTEVNDIAGKVNYDIKEENLEKFLSQIEAYLQIYPSEITVQDFLTRAKTLILDECTTFLTPSDTLEVHKDFLHRLTRRRTRDPRLMVFTTNYDLCFEQAASALGLVYLDGFSFSHPRRYDARYYTYDIVRRPRGGNDSGDYLQGVFLLYKLHGSVDWEQDSNGSGDICISASGRANPNKACLIYPAAGKYQQSYMQPYLESMAQYLAAIREPNTCVMVVGFGFNDSHLAEPLIACAKSNPHLRLLIVDPYAQQKVSLKTGTEDIKNVQRGTAGGTSPYWQQLLELSRSGKDIWLINATFRQMVTLIPDLKALSPGDRLLNTIRGVVRET